MSCTNRGNGELDDLWSVHRWSASLHPGAQENPAEPSNKKAEATSIKRVRENIAACPL